jgi:hypothetical protein
MQLTCVQLLFSHQGVPPTLFKQIGICIRMSHSRCNFGPAFILQFFSPRICSFSCLTVNFLSTRVKELRGWVSHLGAYVRANRVASGALCVFTSKSTQALESPSWNRVANARLFCPCCSARSMKEVSSKGNAYKDHIVTYQP